MEVHPDLQVVDEGPIRHIILNRPSKLNAMKMSQHDAIITLLKEAKEDKGVGLVTFSGNGTSFCAGDDLKAIGKNFQNPEGWPERYIRRHMVDLEIGIGPLLLQEALSSIRHFPKPTAALMHGYAIGAGYDYALCCDFRAVTPDCRFGDPRIHRAIWCAEGWSYKLPRIIPLGFSSKIALLGELLTGEQAVEMGIAHLLLPADVPVRDSARGTLESLARVDLGAYQATKFALLNNLDLSYETSKHIACSR